MSVFGHGGDSTSRGELVIYQAAFTRTMGARPRNVAWRSTDVVDGESNMYGQE